MAITGLQSILGAHRLFAGLDPAFLDLVAGCAKNAVFPAGAYLFEEGAAADRFYLIRAGRIGLEISAPGRGRMTFQTAGEGEVVGLSWLVPPYRWTYDARALEDSRAIALDAHCLRDKCEADPALGFAVMQRFMPTLVERLHSARLQMLDVYGKRA